MEPPKRDLRASCDAVSPVIGTILMVAITVVLAAVVVVLVADMGSDEVSPPNISLSVSETRDRATVSAASPDASWDQLEIMLDADGGWALNGEAATGTTGGEWAFVGGGTVLAGDYLHICADGGGDVHVSIRYHDLNTIISRFTLRPAGAC